MTTEKLLMTCPATMYDVVILALRLYYRNLIRFALTKDMIGVNICLSSLFVANIIIIIIDY